MADIKGIQTIGTIHIIAVSENPANGNDGIKIALAIAENGDGIFF